MSGKRAILALACAPVLVGAAGYGFARKMSGYFTNLPEVAERMADATIAHFEERAGEILGLDQLDSAHHPIIMFY